MDEPTLVITCVSAAAGTVGAFYLRTEAIKSDFQAEYAKLRAWIDEKYMTREAINLKFDALQSSMANVVTTVANQSRDIRRMEQRQQIQIGYLEKIGKKLNIKEDEHDSDTT